MERRLMANGPNELATTPHQCWSCKEEIAPTDNFCRHCGMKLTHEGSAATDKARQQSTSPSVNIHERLASIEKLLLKTLVGVGALLLLTAWIVLQMFHFGRQ
jgi:predicted amidophosphoribosyltransferase